MGKHAKRAAEIGWLPLMSFITVLAVDMSVVLPNLDRNIHHLLGKAMDEPPDHLASYAWDNPIWLLAGFILLAAVGTLTSWAAERCWTLVAKKFGAKDASHAGKISALEAIGHRQSPRLKYATDHAAEEMERVKTWTWASHLPPVETSYPRISAETTALLQEIRSRIAYVSRVLSENVAADLRNWRGKINSQRVLYDKLDNDPLMGLTQTQAENVRTAARCLGELDNTINMIVADPRKFKPAQVAGMYKHRAEKALSALLSLRAALDVDITCVDDEADLLISLDNAATELWSELRGAFKDRDGGDYWDDGERGPGVTAHKIVGEDLIPIWGAYSPSTAVAPIPKDDASNFSFSGDAQRLSDPFDRTREYTNLQVRKPDFERRRDQLRHEYRS